MSGEALESTLQQKKLVWTSFEHQLASIAYKLHIFVNSFYSLPKKWKLELNLTPCCHMLHCHFLVGNLSFSTPVKNTLYQNQSSPISINQNHSAYQSSMAIMVIMVISFHEGEGFHVWWPGRFQPTAEYSGTWCCHQLICTPARCHPVSSWDAPGFPQGWSTARGTFRLRNRSTACNN